MYHIRKWNSLAEKKLSQILEKAQEFPTLKKRMSLKKSSFLKADVEVVGATRMTQLNGDFRGKHYPTDVLSFPSPSVFKKEGMIGTLIICLPTLRKQAKQLGHSAQVELEVLLVHGVLHLLGFDHEQGPVQEKQMARWEQKLLQRAFSRGSGLIRRSDSGKKRS